MGDESEKDEKARDERLRAVIADEDPFARRVIKDALTESGVMVIAEARTGRQAVELALYYRPDVVIMDVVMPELDGIMATRQILKMVPDQLVIVLTGAGDEDDELGLQALRAGAAGFISKDVDINALPQALEGCVWGGRDLAEDDQARDRAAAERSRRRGGPSLWPTGSPSVYGSGERESTGVEGAVAVADRIAVGGRIR